MVTEKSDFLDWRITATTTSPSLLCWACWLEVRDLVAAVDEEHIRGTAGRTSDYIGQRVIERARSLRHSLAAQSPMSADTQAPGQLAADVVRDEDAVTGRVDDPSPPSPPMRKLPAAGIVSSSGRQKSSSPPP
jgi:hypothetical protein